MKIQLPEHVKQIIHRLQQEGYDAYAVGGCVRDTLLGRSPQDWDITTSAKPQVVKSLFSHTIDTGIAHGTVTVMLDHTGYEVTTYRIDGEYEDARHPKTVTFTGNLVEDLKRRDFTINAMAYNDTAGLVDAFDGIGDLKRHVIRCVGIPHDRFGEDALRMLRACRFVAQLGFTYEQTGCEALPACGAPNTPYFLPHSYSFPVERCAGLSLERVRKELEKLITSEYAGKGLMLMMATGLLGANCHARENGNDTVIPILPEALHLLGLHQNPRFHLYDTWEHTLLAIDNSPHDLAIRWALVLHDLGKGLPKIRKLNKEGQPSDPGHEAKSAIMAQAILTRLGYNNSFVHLVTWLVAQHMRFAPMLLTGERTLLRWVRSEAASSGFRTQAELTQAYSLLVEVFLADMGATHARENEQLMAEGRLLGRQVVELVRTRMPVCSKDLAIGGRELLELVHQSEIKSILFYLLERVQSGNLPNEKEALLTAVHKHLKRKATISSGDNV